MEEIFRTLTLPEIRTRYVELGIERDGFKASSSASLGAAYPEMLEICTQISGLQVAAAEHESALKALSSVDNLSRWRRIAANTDDYHARVTAEAKRREIERLKARVTRSINSNIAEGAVLEASRLFYLLQALDPEVSPNTRLDEYLDKWLLKPSDDLDSIVAYILRHRVPPSTVAERLARHRLAQLRRLPVLEGVYLMDHTITSLQYISDYELKLKLHTGRLVDSLDVGDRSILPPHVLELPLYPDCFTQPGTFDNSQFVGDAERLLRENVDEFAKTASATDVISLYSLLVRDCPQLAAASHKTLVGRLEDIVDGLVLDISVPEKSAMPPQVPFDGSLGSLASIDSIVLQVRGQCGPLETPLELIYAWHDKVADVRAQVQVLGTLESRVSALKGTPQQLLARLDSQTSTTIEQQVRNISDSPNHVAAVLLVSALDPQSSATAGLYGLVADDMVSEWALDTDRTRLDGFPSTGLLRSLGGLVDQMDRMAPGFVWTEDACIGLRKKAAQKLAAEFEQEMPFVWALFGLDPVEAGPVKSATKTNVEKKSQKPESPQDEPTEGGSAEPPTKQKSKAESNKPEPTEGKGGDTKSVKSKAKSKKKANKSKSTAAKGAADSAEVDSPVDSVEAKGAVDDAEIEGAVDNAEIEGAVDNAEVDAANATTTAINNTEGEPLKSKGEGAVLDPTEISAAISRVCLLLSPLAASA